MQGINCRHENDILMCDILIYDRKHMHLAGWLLQIEKGALITKSKEYELIIQAPNIK